MGLLTGQVQYPGYSTHTQWDRSAMAMLSCDLLLSWTHAATGALVFCNAWLAQWLCLLWCVKGRSLKRPSSTPQRHTHTGTHQVKPSYVRQATWQASAKLQYPNYRECWIACTSTKCNQHRYLCDRGSQNTNTSVKHHAAHHAVRQWTEER